MDINNLYTKDYNPTIVEPCKCKEYDGVIYLKGNIICNICLKIQGQYSSIRCINSIDDILNEIKDYYGFIESDFYSCTCKDKCVNDNHYDGYYNNILAERLLNEKNKNK